MSTLAAGSFVSAGFGEVTEKRYTQPFRWVPHQLTRQLALTSVLIQSFSCGRGRREKDWNDLVECLELGLTGGQLRPPASRTKRWSIEF